MAKAFTTDYEHFADENLGLLPYIATSVKELIQSEDTDKLHKLQEDIALVADNLYDLLDEVDSAVKKYEQMKNKKLAIEAAMKSQSEALQAVVDEMNAAFGDKVDDTPELILESAEGTRIVRVEDTPVDDAMTEEMKTFMDEMLTVENVVGTVSPEEGKLRDIGLVFNDEIDEIAAAEENQSFDIDADDDDGLFTDFNLPEEDVDDGYKPLAAVDESDDYSLNILTEDPEPLPLAVEEESNLMNILEDDDFMNMFDNDDNPITDDELVMDDDEFAVIDIDDYGTDIDDDDDDVPSGSTPSVPTVNNDATPTGFIPPDFF